MRSRFTFSLLVAILALPVNDALALAGFSEPESWRFSDCVFMCFGMSFFIALPTVLLLSSLATVLYLKKIKQQGQTAGGQSVFVTALLAFMGLYVLGVLALSGIAVLA
jgi:hypothetical protein